MLDEIAILRRDRNFWRHHARSQIRSRGQVKMLSSMQPPVLGAEANATFSFCLAYFAGACCALVTDRQAAAERLTGLLPDADWMVAEDMQSCLAQQR